MQIICFLKNFCDLTFNQFKLELSPKIYPFHKAIGCLSPLFVWFLQKGWTDWDKIFREDSPWQKDGYRWKKFWIRSTYLWKTKNPFSVYLYQIITLSFRVFSLKHASKTSVFSVSWNQLDSRKILTTSMDGYAIVQQVRWSWRHTHTHTHTHTPQNVIERALGAEIHWVGVLKHCRSNS